jgi:hypothetical protein
MKQVILAENPLEPETWEQVEVEDLCAFLQERFSTFPATARIYHEQVSQDRDVTPGNEAGVERLRELPGPFYVVVYPGDPITIVVATVAVVAGIAATLLLVPPIGTVRNTQSSSPNNALAERTNRPRPNGRVPDIYGTVRSTPDLLTLPYKVFKDHREVEVAFFCVGRGEYEIHDLYDDNTPVSEIEGMSVEVYGPNTSPLSGDPPQMSEGAAITDELSTVQRSTGVNGQTLYAPDFKTIVGTDNIRIENSTKLKIRDTAVVVWPEHFDVGDTVVITNGTVDSKNFSGTYTVAAVDNDFLTLDNPGAVNAAWSAGGLPSSWYGPTVASDLETDIGPFFIDVHADGQVIANVVALGGMFKDNGNSQTPAEVEVEFDLTPVDSGGTPTGLTQTFSTTVVGSGTTRSLRASTLIMSPTPSGRVKIVGRRLTAMDRDFDGTVVDEVKWRDLYVLTPLDEDQFGNVTTVGAVTYGTDGALALKDRKLNMEVTRKLRLFDAEGVQDVTATATNDAGQILIATALDPYIGGRTEAELDIPGILATTAEVVSYFGVAEAADFNYTFDNANLSFEEIASVIAEAAFCSAFRRGRLIQLSFEKETEDSKLLFNHRNKTPGSETRTVSFGRASDFDGVAYEYVDAEDDAVVTLYVPQGDDSAMKPRRVESLGVRNAQQAHLHAWRAWNKIKYQTCTTEFEATQEAELVLPTERILVADNTRADTWDGEVVEQYGLALRLSQPFVPPGGRLDHTVFLQLSDGTVQAIEIAAVTDDPYLITLAEAPNLPLSLAVENYAQATYIIQGSSPARPSAFLVADKDPQPDFTVRLSAINYDSRYYANDQDFA